MVNIIVADDDDGVLSILGATLNSAGHKTVLASNGIEVLEILDNKGCADLLLTDVIMPGLNGFNLARMVIMRWPSIKILYLTAFHEMEITLRDKGDRYGKLLTKPILPDDLVREVEEATHVYQE